MKHCKLSFYQLFSLVLIFCWFFSHLQAQSLNWDYEDVLTDIQQSGANPDMVEDDQGNLHVSFWRVEADQLAYAFRDKSTGIWSMEMLDTGTSFQGYKSAILVDDLHKVHIAYFKKNQGLGQIRYITNASGSWQVEVPFPNIQAGVYGIDLLFPRYAQPSLDIILKSDGQPVIFYFDANTYSFANCGNPINKSYINYELDMKLMSRSADGSWQYHIFPNIPGKAGYTCLPMGDRFGEFCQGFSLPDGRVLVITNSFHNHDLLLFESGAGDLNSWSYRVLDSTARVQTQIRLSDFREAYEFIDASLVGDSSLHLIYGVSKEYGYGLIEDRRKHLIYAHVNLDSLQSTTYKPYYYRFLPAQIYRSYSTITNTSDDSVYAAFYDLETRVTVLAESFNQGLSWSFDTIHTFNINAYLQSVVEGDSIRILAYSPEKDRLLLSSRSLSGGNWRHELATIYEETGQAISSFISRASGQDEIHIAFNESGEDQLYYGLKTGGTWSFDPVGQAGKRIAHVNIFLDPQTNVCIAYSNASDQTLNFAHKNGNNWVTQIVENNSIAQHLTVATHNNDIHISYFDLSQGFLKHAYANSTAGPWTIEVVDSSSSIIGRYADSHIDAGGALHISYLDIINSKVKYAHKAPGGNWVIEDVTETLNYSPNIAVMKINSQALPVIAFTDGNSNQIFLAERGSDGIWGLSLVNAESINLAGNPLRLILDDKDHPWILYNYIEFQDEMRLVRRDAQGNWHQVSIVNNSVQIANQFDFHLVEDDFYIIGKKNQLDNNGIGILFAENGVKTSLPEPEILTHLTIAPNPTSGKLNISFFNPEFQQLQIGLYNLNGQLVHTIQAAEYTPVGQRIVLADISGLGAGVYICSWETGKYRLIRKVILLPR